MKKILFVLSLVFFGSLSAHASEDLRQSFSEATPLNNINKLKTYELRDKFGVLESEGGKWKCVGKFKKLQFSPLTSRRWWSPNTSADLISLRDGKVTAVSCTSSKEMAFREKQGRLLIELIFAQKI